AAAISQGGLVAYGIIGLTAGAFLCLTFRVAPFAALVGWIVLSGVAYPFVRLPQGHPIATFDRAWIAALACALLIREPDGDERPDRRESETGGVGDRGRRRPSTPLAWCLAALTVAYGLRA